MKNILFYTLLAALFLGCANTETKEETTAVDEVETDLIAEDEPSNEVTTANQIIEDLDAAAFNSKINSTQGVLIDVRTPDEFSGGTINNAQNINYRSNDFEEQLDSLDKTQPVYVFCQGGLRSSKAKKMLADKGFQEVYNLLGGYGAWPYKN